MTGFTNAQAEALEKMVNTAISLRVFRENPSAGELGSIPDIAKVESNAKDAADKAIDDFKASQKPWWDLRNRRDSQIAAGGLAVLILFGVVDRVTNDAELMLQAVHWTAGTEQMIETEMTNALADWADGRESKPGVPLQRGINTDIDNLALNSEFQRRMGTALFAQARNRDPEFVRVIEGILADQPIVMFQGQAVLGGFDTAPILSLGCNTLVSYWFSTAPELLPDDLRPPENTSDADKVYLDARSAAIGRLCSANGIIIRRDSLEVPFWAQLHPKGNRTAHKVHILIQIDPVPKTADEVINHLPYEVWKGAKPMELKYANSRNKGEGFADKKLFPKQTSAGSRFFVAEIDPLTIPRPPDLSVGDSSDSDILHSVTLTVPTFEEKDVCGTPSFPVACIREVSVRVMVIVNRPES